MFKEIRTPLEGGASNDNEEAKKARERLRNMSSPTTIQPGEHVSSFIGEMQPSVVWSQSATHLAVSAKLRNMQKTLECKNCYCICHSTSAVAV